MKWSLVVCAAIGAASFACSDSNDNDSGTGSDAGLAADVIAHPDAAPNDAGRVDSGTPRPDSGVVDGGEHFCTTNGRVLVEQAEVSVGNASTPGTHADNSPADLSCIDAPPTNATFNALIFIRGCLNAVGDPLTAQEVQDLRVDLFPAKDQTGAAVDPSFDFTTGVDRDPAANLEINYSFDTNVQPNVCSGRVQVEIGFDSPSLVLQSEREYIVRVRTASTAAQPVLPPTYFFGLIVRNSNVSGAPVQLDLCTNQQCYLRHNFNVIRSSDLATAVGAAQTPVPGGADLGDGLGAGYGMIETYDCTDLPMAHAVAGFNPAPLNDLYANGSMFDYARTESSANGVYLGVGFPGQAATASTAVQVVGAIGAARDTVCTEELGGRTVTIFPDSISVIRSSNEIVLHGR